MKLKPLEKYALYTIFQEPASRWRHICSFWHEPNKWWFLSWLLWIIMDFTTKLKQQMALEMLFQIGVTKQEDLKVRKTQQNQLKYKWPIKTTLQMFFTGSYSDSQGKICSFYKVTRKPIIFMGNRKIPIRIYIYFTRLQVWHRDFL